MRRPCSRPRIVLLAAEGNATRGRRSHESRPQNDDLLEEMGKFVWEMGRLALWGDSIVTLFAAQHCNAFCGDSTVAHFARKVRGAKVAAIAL